MLGNKDRLLACSSPTGPAFEGAQISSGQRAAPGAIERVRIDPDTLEPVPADGTTIGEILFRGNIVMKGYLKNPAATDKAFAGGWFHAVHVHANKRVFCFLCYTVA